MALKKSRKKNTTQSQNEKRDCNQIRNELLSDDASSRRWAARDIVNCPGATHMLLDQLNNEEEPSVRQVILSSLTQALSPTLRCMDVP